MAILLPQIQTMDTIKENNRIQKVPGEDEVGPQPLPSSSANFSTNDLQDAIQPFSISQTPDETLYHVFGNKRKWLLVYIVSAAGMFSPLSSNIYFPAIDTIATDLHASSSLIALTITIYMVVQGIAPSFWGPWSDTCGRRLVFIWTLGIYIMSNLALAFTDNYPMLLALRGVQAAGSAATISIGTGVVADVAAPSESIQLLSVNRSIKTLTQPGGGFIGTNSGIRMIAQALGPVLGGILNGIWGFRSIFWLLFVAGGIVLGMLLTFLPETHREIAGNGSVPLRGIHRPFIYLVVSTPKEWVVDPSRPITRTPPLSFKKVFMPLAQLFEKDILALLIWGALVYTVWSMVTSSSATIFIREFPGLTQVELGLCFLPNGFGCVMGSILAGKLMDHSYKVVEKHYRRAHGIPEDVMIKDDRHFPYERARLSPMPYLAVGFIFATALYGASYELNDINRYAVSNLIISLVLQFFIAFIATWIFSINSAMMVDCFPTAGAGATAVNNLARCLLGAVGVSVVQPMINAIHIRNTFVILAAIVVIFSPLIWVEWKWGEQWRLEREERKDRQEL